MSSVALRESARAGSHSRNMLVALLGNGYPAFIAFFTGPVLAHALGVHGRGEVAAAAAPLSLVTTIATFGVPEAVTYVSARSPWLARAALGRGLALLAAAGVLSGGVVVLAAPALSGGDARVRTLIYVACLAIVPSLLVSVVRGLASARQRWRLVTAERMTSATLRLVVLIPFWLTGTLTPFVAVCAIAAIPVLGGSVYWRVLWKEARAPAASDPAASYSMLMSFGSRVWVGSLAGVLLTRLDQTIMTPLAGTAQLGIYVVAVSIGELPLMINSAVRDVTFVADARGSVDDRLASSARISSALCLVAGGALALMLPWAIPRLFGPGFGESIPVAFIILGAVVVGTPGSVGGSGLSARGYPGLRSWSLVVACLTNVVLLIVLAPRFGAMGAAWATFVGNVIASNLNLFFLRRKCGMPVADFYGFHRSDLQTLRTFAERLARRG